MKFTDDMAAAFPKRNPLPDVLRHALQFMEEHGCVQTRRDGVRYMTVYPEPEYDDVTANAFHVPDPAATAGWTHRDDPEVNDRLVIFLRTGGDGSWAGLWLDDDGHQRIVHVGSGSGSVMLCVLTENMEDLLRLLAIGYAELCWPDDFQRTPAEVFEEHCDDEDDDTPPPLLFQDYVEGTLGLSIPERASEIVSSTVSMDDPESRDPFWNWIKRLQDQ
ncbi:hypothetical protein F2P45_10975 [Massilia sp. CCM 8733]|uniref:SMI1/KNR4 family protein n=1 Tax=Massilia mucilaginosa TaxID=2609282 RepID=A0ABX0NRZ8_9BURK|nr:hypothetical protein [Massilia mucilaginosa]NHZ89533.1 hypothetical protein [Massilia mucilaginosa]